VIRSGLACGHVLRAETEMNLALLVIAGESASSDGASLLSVVAIVIGTGVLVGVPLASPDARRKLGRWWRHLASRVEASLLDGSQAQDRAGRRQQLIDRKHATMGEIRMLQREIRSLEARGVDVSERNGRLRKLQSEHYRLRLEIDRTRP
jgi:hypothetical protein